jgi:hypothetical protein
MIRSVRVMNALINIIGFASNGLKRIMIALFAERHCGRRTTSWSKKGAIGIGPLSQHDPSSPGRIELQTMPTSHTAEEEDVHIL